MGKNTHLPLAPELPLYVGRWCFSGRLLRGNGPFPVSSKHNSGSFRSLPKLPTTASFQRQSTGRGATTARAEARALQDRLQEELLTQKAVKEGFEIFLLWRAVLFPPVGMGFWVVLCAGRWDHLANPSAHLAQRAATVKPSVLSQGRSPSRRGAILPAIETSWSRCLCYGDLYLPPRLGGSDPQVGSRCLGDTSNWMPFNLSLF